jgi:hypothetical protein
LAQILLSVVNQVINHNRLNMSFSFQHPLIPSKQKQNKMNILLNHFSGHELQLDADEFENLPRRPAAPAGLQQPDFFFSAIALDDQLEFPCQYQKEQQFKRPLSQLQPLDDYPSSPNVHTHTFVGQQPQLAQFSPSQYHQVLSSQLLQMPASPPISPSFTSAFTMPSRKHERSDSEAIPPPALKSKATKIT